MAYVELIMEVNRSLLEATFNLRVDAESGLDHDSDEFLHGALVLAKVLVEEGTEDSKERLLLRELNCAKEKVTLETWVHNKGACSRIHSGYVHCALDLFDC